MNYFQVMSIKTLLAHKSTYFWLAQFWTLFVAILCLMNGSNLPHIRVNGVDKYVHFSFHFLFAFFWFMYLYKNNLQPRIAAQWVFAGSLIFGILIELAQAFFTVSRNADVFDVLANTIGAFAALSLISLIIYFVHSKT
jgi:VanZ family protein